MKEFTYYSTYSMLSYSLQTETHLQLIFNIIYTDFD